MGLGGRGSRRTILLGAAMACMALALTPAAAWAGVVTTEADGNGSGTLRGEIANAAPGDTITFNPAVNPTLTMGEIMVTKDITIAGNGIGQTTIIGGSGDRIFNVNLSDLTTTLTIRDLTIASGHAPAGVGLGTSGGAGGGIFLLGGHLVIDRVAFNGNVAGNGTAGTVGPSGGMGTGGTGGAGGTGGEGGAIIATGASTLVVQDSIFTDNVAGAGGDGGVGGSGFSGGGTGGSGGFGGDGGAISTYVSTSITNTIFTGNQGGLGGAGGNGGSGGFGGNGGSGSPGGDGGAITQGPITPTMTIQGSTFDGNIGGTGGTGGDGGFGAGTGGVGGSGGAVWSLTPDISNSTFAANQSGLGGPGGMGLLGEGIGGDGGNGGALAGHIGIRSTTIARNTTGMGGAGSTQGGNGVGGGLDSQSPGTMVGSIVAGNTLGGGPTTEFLANCSGAAPSTNTSNLTFPANTGCVATVGDPVLGPLADNDGPTKTMALGPGSAAIDQLPVGSNCPATDQRGIARPQGPACDIGAFELVPTPPANPANAAAPKAKKCKKKHKKHAKKKKRCKKKRKKHKK
jgi:hypothetical protein